MSLDALQVTILPEFTGEGRECLVERVRRDRADRATEHIRFDEPDRLAELVLAEDGPVVVVIQLEQERVCDIDPEFAQVPECVANSLRRCPIQCHRAVVVGKPLDIRSE